MSFTIECACGRTTSVTASQAASLVPCACGKLIEVPALSRLRQSAGQGAYETGIIDTIRRMIDEGTLPAGRVCAISGDPTSDSYELYVQCESPSIKGTITGHSVADFFLMFVLPSVQLHYWTTMDEERREVGYDRGVTVPLRVCRQCHDQLRRMRSQWRLRRLLETVPIYAQLLREFPDARISTE